MKRLILKCLPILLFSCFIFISSSCTTHKEKAPYDEMYKSQIRVAKMFLEILEDSLKIGEESLEQSKRSLKFKEVNSKNLPENNPDLEIFELKNKFIVKCKKAIRIAKEHIKGAKEHDILFDEIAKNYVSINEIRIESKKNINARPVNINAINETEKFTNIFESQVEAIEIFIKYFEQRLKSEKTEFEFLKSFREKQSKIGMKRADTILNDLGQLDVRILAIGVKLAEAKIDFAKGCLKSAKAGNIAFEELANILPKRHISNIEIDIDRIDINKRDVMFDSIIIKFSKREIKFLKEKLKTFQNEFKALVSKIKNLERDAKTSPELINVLKAESKVIEMQVDINKLYLKQAESNLKFFIERQKEVELNKKKEKASKKKLDKWFKDSLFSK
jgi:chromosome segregation protein